MAWLDWVTPEWERTGYWREVLDDMRGRYGEVYALILEAISHSDPAGLLRAGFPPDEYSREAEEIYLRLPGTPSVDDVRQLMRDVFVDCFSEHIAGPVADYDAPAREFW